MKAIAINKNPIPASVDVIYYTPKRSNTPNIHPWLLDMESTTTWNQCAEYHMFMRTLPGILKARPQARIVIVGGDDVRS